MGRAHWGNPPDPPRKQQGGYPRASGLSPATLHRGPSQMSPGAVEATGDKRASTQSRRRSPAKQRDAANQARRVRQLYCRLAGAIPPVVRDTPHGMAAPRVAAQMRRHVAIPTGTCGDTLPPGTPSRAPAGADPGAPELGQRQTQNVFMVRPSACIVKGGIPSSRRYVSYLPQNFRPDHGVQTLAERWLKM